jgi:hypothetical protein
LKWIIQPTATPARTAIEVVINPVAVDRNAAKALIEPDGDSFTTDASARLP